MRSARQVQNYVESCLPVALQLIAGIGLLIMTVLGNKATAGDTASVQIAITKPSTVVPSMEHDVIALDEQNGFSNSFCVQALAGSTPFTLDLDPRQTSSLNGYFHSSRIAYKALSKTDAPSSSCWQRDSQIITVTLNPSEFSRAKNDTYLGTLTVLISPE